MSNTMANDYRALCAELLDALDSGHQTWRILASPLVARARAALAAEPVADGPAVPEGREPASVVGEPSDEELLKLARAELDNSPNWEEPEYDPSNPFPYEAPGVAWLNFARAVLARFGDQTAPPAEGEVVELVEGLQEQANYGICDVIGGDKLTRAADLLSQRHPTPVSAAERLPGPRDCTAQGWCWVFYQGFATWTLEPPLGQDGKHTGYTHWLPATALPLPAVEVQP